MCLIYFVQRSAVQMGNLGSFCRPSDMFKYFLSCCRLSGGQDAGPQVHTTA